jgi:hypothetical protein
VISIRRSSPTAQRIAGFVAILIGFLIAASIAFQEYRNWQFDQPVKHSTGVITKLYRSAGRHSSASPAKYDFGVPGGFIHQTQQIGDTTWRELKEGQLIPVKYLSTDPSISRIDPPVEDQYQRRSNSVGWIMCVIFLAIGPFNFLLADRRR